jgi:hypothetical protein
MSDHNPPRRYDLHDPAELQRLYRETLGYLRTCQTMGHGSDLPGREHAMDAFRRLISTGATFQARTQEPRT